MRAARTVNYLSEDPLFSYSNSLHGFWRSGTERAANGEAVLPIVVVGRIDIAGAVEVEVVGVAGASTRGR